MGAVSDRAMLDGWGPGAVLIFLICLSMADLDLSNERDVKP